MKLTSHPARRLAAAAITCAAILLPATALASAGSAATAGSPASGARPTRPVTAYVVNGGSDTVTPIRTATDTALKPIKVGEKAPAHIAITPNGKTAYVANNFSGTVTPINTATNTAGKAITVGNCPGAIAITPNGKTVYLANTGAFRPAGPVGDTVTPCFAGSLALFCGPGMGRAPHRRIHRAIYAVLSST